MTVTNMRNLRDVLSAWQTFGAALWRVLRLVVCLTVVLAAFAIVIAKPGGLGMRPIDVVASESHTTTVLADERVLVTGSGSPCPVSMQGCTLANQLSRWFAAGDVASVADQVAFDEVTCRASAENGNLGPAPVCDGAEPGEQRAGYPFVIEGFGGYASRELYESLLRQVTAASAHPCPTTTALGSSAYTALGVPTPPASRSARAATPSSSPGLARPRAQASPAVACWALRSERTQTAPLLGSSQPGVRRSRPGISTGFFLGRRSARCHKGRRSGENPRVSR